MHLNSLYATKRKWRDLYRTGLRMAKTNKNQKKAIEKRYQAGSILLNCLKLVAVLKPQLDIGISWNGWCSTCLAVLDNCRAMSIMISNNTPPASRQISAPRGVTRFWGGAEK